MHTNLLPTDPTVGTSTKFYLYLSKRRPFLVLRPDFSFPIDPLYRPIYFSVVHRCQKMTLDY